MFCQKMISWISFVFVADTGVGLAKRKKGGRQLNRKVLGHGLKVKTG